MTMGEQCHQMFRSEIPKKRRPAEGMIQVDPTRAIPSRVENKARATSADGNARRASSEPVEGTVCAREKAAIRAQKT